ncbi:hypothetical protein [Schlesneria paludicola]|uniref:hypothetical protein n=1 Tax=Schlesneria paludicola TaxID=360056 RepID=UPI00029B2872|nr:hypothetical protein [Schlesneria paludicola]
MSDEQLQPVSNEANPADSSCPTGGHCRRSGLMRAVLYTPVVVILSGLAALAMFPELSRYATPLVGDSSSGNISCPISALASRLGCGSCPSKSSADTVNAVLASAAANQPSGCCSTSAIARFGCCAGATACQAEASEAEESPVTDVAPSTDEAPADAFTAANVDEANTPSN